MRYPDSVLVTASEFSGLAASPRDAPQAKNSAQKMERASVRGGALEYEVRGDGEPVLLIHGSLIAGSFLPLMSERAYAKGSGNRLA